MLNYRPNGRRVLVEDLWKELDNAETGLLGLTREE